MKITPILFSGPMVKAILDGRKTQTRRVVKWKPYDKDCAGINFNFSGMDLGHYMTDCPETGWVLRSRGGGGCWNDRTKPIHCPYGGRGDRLWVREKARMRAVCGGHWVDLVYEADDAMIEHQRADSAPFKHTSWTPSIHMPRWAARVTLEVVSVRIGRLKEISTQDAVAEGCGQSEYLLRYASAAAAGTVAGGLEQQTLHALAQHHGQPVAAYARLWDSLNEARGFGWDKNPWVWAIEFKRLHATQANEPAKTGHQIDTESKKKEA